MEDTAIFTDTLGRAKETTEILTVTTKAQENATANKPFHDTALIQGNVVAGTQIEFELWQRAEGDDVSKDKLVTTTDRVTLKGGETKVDSDVYKRQCEIRTLNTGMGPLSSRWRRPIPLM